MMNENAIIENKMEWAYIKLDIMKNLEIRAQEVGWLQ